MMRAWANSNNSRKQQRIPHSVARKIAKSAAKFLHCCLNIQLQCTRQWETSAEKWSSQSALPAPQLRTTEKEVRNGSLASSSLLQKRQTMTPCHSWQQAEVIQFSSLAVPSLTIRCCRSISTGTCRTWPTPMRRDLSCHHKLLWLCTTRKME